MTQKSNFLLIAAILIGGVFLFGGGLAVGLYAAGAFDSRSAPADKQTIVVPTIVTAQHNEKTALPKFAGAQQPNQKLPVDAPVETSSIPGSPKETTPQAIEPMEKRQVDARYSLENLGIFCGGNKNKGESALKDKIVIIEGTVNSFEDTTDQPKVSYMKMFYEKWEINGAGAAIFFKSKDDLARVKIGEYIIAKGRCSKFVQNLIGTPVIVMMDCIILTQEQANEQRKFD